MRKIARSRVSADDRLDNPVAFSDVERATLVELRRRDLIAGPANQPHLTSAGKAWLKRALSEGDAFQAQHQVRAVTTLPDPHDDGPTPMMRNAAESPLLWLRHRRDKSGRAMISDVEFLAGERLSADFRRGALTQGFSRGWVGGDVKVDGGSAPGELHITDTAMAARQRITAALDDLGPQLAEAVVDACHYEFGLTDIEKRRGWPARSAKLVLQIALNRLARHYGLEPPAKS